MAGSQGATGGGAQPAGAGAWTAQKLDQALQAKAAAKDANGFMAVLVQSRFLDRLEGLLIGKFPGSKKEQEYCILHKHEREQAIADACLHVFNKMSQGGVQKPSAYIRDVVFKKAVDIYRAKVKAGGAPLDAERLAAEVADDVKTVHGLTSALGKVPVVREALRRARDYVRQMRVVHMRNVMGLILDAVEKGIEGDGKEWDADLPTEQIAQILNLPQTVVSLQRFRGFKRLQEMAEKDQLLQDWIKGILDRADLSRDGQEEAGDEQMESDEEEAREESDR